MKVTIKTISEATGISCSTISRVLTNQEYVKPETRLKVEQAISKLGYKYHRKKHNTANDISKLVVIITGDLESRSYLNYVRGINKKLSSAGYKCLTVESMMNPQKEEEYLRFASENGFAGVFMLSAVETESLIQQLQHTTCPVIFVNRFLRSIDTDVILIDNYRGGYMATQHLISAGHKNIAHLAGPKSSSVSQDRLYGYKDAMNDAGLPIKPEFIYYGDLTAESGEVFANHLLSDGQEITAVFSTNDIMAVSMVETLLKNGKRIPDDISIVCFDNTPITVQGKVKLTTIGMDSLDMGITAGEVFLERLNSTSSNTRKIIYPPTLTCRDSVKQH